MTDENEINKVCAYLEDEFPEETIKFIRFASLRLLEDLDNALSDTKEDLAQKGVEISDADYSKIRDEFFASEISRK